MPKPQINVGFTLIELLIVLVIIMVILSISIPNYFGLQNRARDERRKADIATLVRAMELYKVENNHYPQGIPNSTRNDWSDSDLFPKDYIQKFGSFTDGSLLVDPLNNDTYHYSYRLFEGGGFGCTKAFYILGIKKFERDSKIASWKCPEKDFGMEFDWAVGGYE